MLTLMQLPIPMPEKMPDSALATIIWICVALLVALSGAGYLLLNSHLTVANSLRSEVAEARKDNAIATEKRDERFLHALDEARDLHKEAIGTIVQDNKQTTAMICQTFKETIGELSRDISTKIESAKCRHDGA
ncbi:MAG: hypothetical protein ACOYNN_18825, partial [Terrimicrobiaceae bacterium]